MQLRSVDLPNLFEQSIQESEVKKQDIQKAGAELKKVEIEVDTLKKAANFQKNVTINLASGEASAILQQNQANVKSLQRVQDTQSQAYSSMKDKLKLTNPVLLNFIKSKLIKNYEGNSLALNLESPDK